MSAAKEYPQYVSHYLGKPILSIEDVAEMLNCSVDKVRRISRSKLPCMREGRRNVYLLEHVIEYVREEIRAGNREAYQMDSPPTDEMLKSIADSVRGRSLRWSHFVGQFGGVCQINLN
jgi:hypothetical protein